MNRHTAPALKRIALILAALAFVALPLSQPAAAQNGADLEVTISGPNHVKILSNITYTITATNIGDETATGVELSGWVPDWFNYVSINCLDGTQEGWGLCSYPDLAPGESARMEFTLQACCKEKTMFELAWGTATNDVNTANNEASIRVIFTGRNPYK
jgi:uncharacterized repeat protein (TIGR01451 family)